MPANIEIKARVRELASCHAAASRLGAAPPLVLDQDDVFFACPAGRLKLRIFPDNTGELIHYTRPDGCAPRRSDYCIAPTSDAAALRAILSAHLPPIGSVRKRRHLYFAGRSRIHLDQVNGLGDFIEIEVLLRPGEADASGAAELEQLAHAFGILPADFEPAAYIDLIQAAARHPSR